MSLQLKFPFRLSWVQSFIVFTKFPHGNKTKTENKKLSLRSIKEFMNANAFISQQPRIREQTNETRAGFSLATKRLQLTRTGTTEFQSWWHLFCDEMKPMSVQCLQQLFIYLNRYVGCVYVHMEYGMLPLHSLARYVNVSQFIMMLLYCADDDNNNILKSERA